MDSPVTSPTDGYFLPEMTPSDLDTVRHQFEPLGLVFTYQMHVYHIPCVDIEKLLMANCSSFQGMTDAQQSYLLEKISKASDSAKDGHENVRRTMSIISSYLQPFMPELTSCLSPIGKLRDFDWPDCIEKFSASVKVTDLQLVEISDRHLRKIRLAEDPGQHCLSKPIYGNEQAFPLDAEINPEILRAEILLNKIDSARDCGNDPVPALIEPSQLYRPYLNNWQPLDFSDPVVPNFSNANNIDEFQSFDSQRLLAVTGGLTWRQKQHRQQLLAVRLATRSALIGLKHSISVEPAKNYLELYVNMISRAVEATSVHVRRWSFHLEHSWKEFKDLATEELPY
uniref:Peptidase_M13_N domain-containing protein n=1 Tax=Macrostomum lignano TaxID=282301 RepID=A0A1I8IU97_9PLAT